MHFEPQAGVVTGQRCLEVHGLQPDTGGQGHGDSVELV
jgi:hypothetical protein